MSFHYDEKELVARAISSARPAPSGWWRAKCPVCVVRVGKPDRRGSLSIYVAEGFYTCHRCGARGRLGLDDRHPGVTPASEPATLIQPPEGFMRLGEEPALSSLAFAAARQYLNRRGVTSTMQKALSIGATCRGNFAGRIIVPIRGGDGTWLGYVGRAWRDDASFPYLYPKGMKKGEILFNHDAITVETDDPVFIVEGVFDAFALWPHGIAVLGKLVPRAPYLDLEGRLKPVTEMQLDALVASRRPVVIVPDGDAWQEGEALAMRLRLEGQRAGFVRLPPKKDPDEVPLDWLREEARQCLN